MDLEPRDQLTIDLLSTHYSPAKSTLNRQVNRRLNTFESQRVTNPSRSLNQEFNAYMLQSEIDVRKTKHSVQEMPYQTLSGSRRLTQQIMLRRTSEQPQRNYFISMVNGQPKQPYIQLQGLTRQEFRKAHNKNELDSPEQLKAIQRELVEYGLLDASAKSRASLKTGIRSSVNVSAVDPLSQGSNASKFQRLRSTKDNWLNLQNQVQTAQITSSNSKCTIVCHSSPAQKEVAQARAFQRISGQTLQNEMKLIDTWKQFYDVKKEKKEQLSTLVSILDGDREFTQSIRRKTYISSVQISPKNTPLRKLRALSENERKQKYDLMHFEIKW